MTAKNAPIVRRPAPPIVVARPGSKPGPGAARPEPQTISDAVGKLHAIRRWASTRLVGRATEVDLVVLALAARCNVLLLGVPGTAKTMLVQTVASSFCHRPGSFFEILMTKFTKPAEVFGPTDVVALRDESELRVATDGYLPEAEVGFLDEVFKASSSILNALLRIANERTFRNGKEWTTCPTRMLVGASNEMPEDPTLLAAFFDRFPLKAIVDPLEADPFAQLVKMVSSPAPSGPCPINLNPRDFEEIDAAVDAVRVSDPVATSICELRAVLKAAGVQPSDRRWVQAIRIVKASAALARREATVRNDPAPIASVLWSTREEIKIVQEKVDGYLNPMAKVLREIADRVFGAKRDVEAAGSDLTAAATAGTKALSAIKQAQVHLETVGRKLAETQDDHEQVAVAASTVGKMIDAIERVVLGKPDGLKALSEVERPS